MVFETDEPAVVRTVSAPSVAKAAPVPFKAHAATAPTKRKATALFDPDASDALVLSRPAPEEDGVAVVLDPLLKRKLHAHQLDGVRFLYDCVMGQRSSTVHGCILADEMYASSCSFAHVHGKGVSARHCRPLHCSGLC
jgi:DNA repair and recombination protein RAD54B